MAKILIVDDEAGARETIKDILAEKGYEVVTAGTGKAAREIAAKDNFEAAIVDIKLPDVLGPELLRSLKEFNPKMEGIIVTGFASTENAIAAMDQGAFAYLLKPIKMDEMLISVARAVEKHNAAVKLEEKKLELEKFNELTRGREQKETELKKEINALNVQLGRPEKYK
ncbi:response regulator [Candidatus Saganbacteria bacterium]|nr:response regulator [Candidatus Saganbacteria bacterium]